MAAFNEILSSCSVQTYQIYSQLFSVDGLRKINEHVYILGHVIMSSLLSADCSSREYLDERIMFNVTKLNTINIFR